MSGDAGEEAVLGQQFTEFLGAFGDPGRGHADVLDDQRGTRDPDLADQAVKAFAHPPVQLDHFFVPAELDLADQFVPGQDFEGGRLAGVERGVIVSAELDQQRCRFRVELSPLLRSAGHVPGGDDQGRSDHQLDRGGPRTDQIGDRFDRRGDVGEVDPGEGGLLGQPDRLEGDPGDEAEGPLGADHQPPQDPDRRLAVDKRAEPVAGGVLDLEFPADHRGEVGVGQDLVPDPHQPADQFRFIPGKLLVGIGRGAVDHGPGGEHELHRGHGRIGVELRPAAHAAGVVGHHAADRGDVGRGRIRAELVAVGCQYGVGVPEHGSGPDRRTAAVVVDLHAGEVPAHVDQDAVGLALAVEAGPAGPEGDADPILPAVGEDFGDVARVVGHHHDLRQLAVGAGVGGVSDQVAGPV